MGQWIYTTCATAGVPCMVSDFKAVRMVKKAESKRSSSKVLQPLSEKKVEKYQKEQSKRGVVYLSRLPPFFQPNKLRSLLGQVGAIDRVYLRVESDEERRKRVKAGGGRRVNFKEAWVEFLSKKDAKKAAELLNNRAIGGKKRNYFHDDLWTIKYLRGFKWTDLTEEAAADRRVRDQLIRDEISQARKERDEFISRFERARAIEEMENRKKESKANDDINSREDGVKVVRNFRQNRVIAEDAADDSDDERTPAVLPMIFGKKRPAKSL